MKKTFTVVLLAGISLWGCKNANNTAQKASSQELPTLDSPLHSKNNFDTFASKFSVGKLPLKTKTAIALGDTIPAHEVLQHLIAPAEKEKISALGDYYGENTEITRKALEDRFLNQEKSIFMVLNFGFGQRLDLHPDYHTLAFQVIPTFMEGGYAYQYIANFDKTGKLLDVVLSGANAGYVDMQQFRVAEITQDGLIKVESKNIKRGGIEDGTNDFTEFTYLTYQLNKVGKFETKEERYTGFSGNFEGKENAEIFKIEQYPAYTQISYQPASDGFQPVQLEVIKIDKQTRTIIAKHPEKDLQFVLTYDQDMKQIVCKNSAGKTFNLSRKG
jgi:hypothetical protein